MAFAPCVVVPRKQVYALETLESALESANTHSPPQTMRNHLSAITSAQGEPKTYGGCFSCKPTEILWTWTCHCLRHSFEFPSDPHSFFRTRRPPRSGCPCSFSQRSVACPVGCVLHCSCFFRLPWVIKQPLVSCTCASHVLCCCLTLLRRNGCCIWLRLSLLNGHSSWKKNPS